MITLMSNFVPSVERQVIWGYTDEEIGDRWKLWEKWDSLFRLFGEGGGKSSFQTKTTIPQPNVSGKALEKLLEKM